MNPSSSASDHHLDERASYWAARLDGSVLSAADRTALDEWLAANPEHRSRLSRYCQLSADLEHLLPALANTGGLDLPEAAPRRRHTRFAWAAAIALAASAAIAVTVWLDQPRSQSHHLATASAHRETLTLVDGSRVELNAQTSVKVDITPEGRRIRLAAGEAFFTVSRDVARPFIVETPAGSVRVIGTRFGVRSETAGMLEVLVEEGSVQVRPQETNSNLPAAPVSLTIGDRLIATDGRVSVETLSPEAVADALAWRKGQIVFAGTPLVEALARFGRYHGRGLTATPDAAGLLLGGRYSLEDLDGFLAALEEALPVRVAHGLSGTTQVSLRTGR